MPHCSLNQSVCSERRGNIYAKHAHGSSMFLLFLLLLPSAAQDLSEISDELPFTCPQGPDKIKCTCTQLEVNCTEVGLFTVPLGLGTSIQSITLRKNLLSSIDSITSQLPSLVYIDASFNSITSVDWLSLSALTTLEELHLQMNLIYSLDLSYFHGTKLHILNVSGNQLIHIIGSGLKLPLQELYIESCGLNYFDFGASISLCKLKVLHVGRNSLTHLPDNAFSCMTDLEDIDLSNNLLTALPATIFDGLDKLRVLNLAGNPWLCDCNLFWLKVFVKSMLTSGSTIVNKNLTHCSTETILSDTISELTTYPFSGCEDGQLSRRSKRASLNWTTKCTIWQSTLLIPICGPSKVASCVYNFTSHSYTLVQFSWEVSGIMSKAECRDNCQVNNNSYFNYDISSTTCLCGDVISNSGCKDCSTSTTTSPSLCSGLYSNVGGTLSVVYDLTINFAPALPEVMSKVNFALNGRVSIYDTFLWNFGDATTRSVLNDKSAFHTYIYPGQFEVLVMLSSSLSQNIPPTEVVTQVTVVSTSDIGNLVCPSSVVTASDILNVSAIFTSAWNQKVKWTRKHQKPNGQVESIESQSCELPWKQFRGRCIQVFTTASRMATAHLTCISKGASLLRFYSNEEIAELKASSLIFQSGAGAHYYTGAEWVSSMGRYLWKNTTSNAYVFRETLSDSAQGDCVALTSTGLQGVACNEQLPFVCEKDPVTCAGNQQYGQMCYVVVNQPATWDQAQFACQSTFKNGRLASVFDSSQNLFVSGLLTSGQTWIGLRARTIPGFYTWQDGKVLGGYTNWVNGSGMEPCVSFNSSSIWQSEACDSYNSYACEYIVGDEVKIPWLVAGFMPVMNDIESPVTAAVVIPPQSVTSSSVTLLLGSWFSSSGRLLKWNIQVESMEVDTRLALQIWRPFCTTGFLAWPGCNNQSPLFTCTNIQGICSTTGMCLDGEYFCIMTNTCLPIAKPCTCASVSSINNLRCQNLVIDSKTSKLQLVYMVTIKVPARTTQVLFEPVTEVTVQAGDITGFQSEDKDAVVCEQQSTSEWRLPVLSASTDYWMEIGDFVDPQSYQLKQDVVCRINAVYATEKSVLSPKALNYVTDAGVYNVTIAINSIISQTCSVTVMEDIRGLLWVYPEARVQIISGPGPQILNVYVESGQPYALTVKVLQGTNPSVAWFLNGGSGISTVFSSSCPASITYPPNICQFHSSLLEYPYSSLTKIFPSGSSLTSIKVNVTNAISWEALYVNIHAYAPVTEVEFYHNNCLNHTTCEVTVEAGKAQEFHMKVLIGDMTLAVFYENGQVIYPSPSNISVLPRLFHKSDVYILSVNVSNPLSWIITNLTVHVQIKANFHNMSFDRVLDRVSAGTLETISANVEVTVGSRIAVTWSFNEESFQFYTQVKTPVLKLNHTYRFSLAGNITVMLFMSDMFGDSLSTSMIVEVYRNIDFQLVLSTFSRYVATLQDFSLTISVDNCSHAENVSYGLLVFSVDWDDGSQSITWRNASLRQEVQHQYNLPGIFTVLLTVMSLYNSSNIQNGTIIIEAQDVITGLSLTYDGPKHFSENITFTAAQKSGSHIEYSVDFGDNITVASFQTSPVFIYKYLVADVYWAIVVARNAVSDRTYKLTLYAYDENLLRIISINAKYYVAVGSTVDMSAEVAAESPSKLFYDWNFGNGLMISGHPARYTTTIYNYIGIFTISLKVQKNISSSISDTHRKDICVEEEISGLTVLYKTPVALKQPEALVYALFQAFVVLGSNLTYTWTVDGGRDIIKQNTLNLTITKAGVYSVVVKVENNLNYQMKTVDLTATEIIKGLQIHCISCSSPAYARTHANTTLEASLLYGTFVSYKWTFEDSSVSKSGEMVQHNFLTPNAYLVTLLAENSVSNDSVFVRIIAQDEVTGVTVRTSPSIVEVNAKITFQASFVSGSSVNISWICDSVKVIGSNSGSLVHAFTSAGYHQCSAVISNAVSSVTETSRLPVLDHIIDLSINHSLKARPGTVTLYAAAGLEYIFTPHTNTDFLVDYEWSIKEQKSSHTVVVGKSILKYTFVSSGTYQTTLTAKNDVSLKNVSITVEVQEKISKVYIGSNKTSPVQVFISESVLFQAVVGTGSQLSYSWTLSGVTQLSRNDSLILPFQNAGNFTVQVLVTNDLDTVTAMIQVSVYIRVSKVAIQIQQSLNLPFLSRETSLDLYPSNNSGTALVYNWTIIHVPTKKQFMSDKMNVSFSFNLIGIYQVILKIKNSLSFDEDQWALVVQGAIKELKVTLQNSVVATGSSLTFTGEVNHDATDVTYLWQIDGEIKQISSFIKLFSKTGEYRVLITAANNVSFMRKESLVRVLDPISNLQILDCQLVRKAQVLTSIQATVDFGTNVTFTWYIEVNKQNKTFSGQTLSINFQTEGSYNIILIAHNDINTKTTNCQLQSQLPISNVTLVVLDPSPDYIFQNQSVTFVADGRNFASATFEWTIANSTFISKSSTYSTLLTISGNTTLTLTISNEVSKIQVFLEFTVKAFLCQLPDVTRVGAINRSVPKSRPLELEVAVDAKGCTDYIAVHRWNVTTCTRDKDADEKVDIRDTTISSPSIVIGSRVLDVGFYCIHFATGYQYTSVSLSVSYTVNVTNSPLKAIIKGGDKRVVATGSNIRFDGTLSFDPDNTSESSLIFKWTCLEITVSGGCFSPRSNDTFYYHFNPGKYKITLEVNATGRTGNSAEQIIEVLNVAEFVPIASVVCVSCLKLGRYRISASQRVVLSAACENCHCKPDFVWTIFEGPKEVFPNSLQTVTGLSRKNLVLNKGGVLKDGFDYKFIVLVSCANITSIVGTASLKLMANFPPSSGVCSFYPTEIIPLENHVIVNCTGWIDPDDPETLISYRIYVNTVDPLSGQNQRYLLYSGTDQTQSVYLSSFAEESVILNVMVGDEFGAFANGGQSVIMFKNVTLPGNITKTDYLMRQTDSFFSALVKQASPISLLQYAIALGQQLNVESQKDKMAQTAGTGTKPEQTRAAVRDAITICLSTAVPITTLEDVQQMAFALRLLTDYSNEYLTEDSQRLLASTLQVINRVLQQRVSNGLDFDDVPLDDLLSVIRNLLSAANARIYSVESVWESGRTITIDNFNTGFRHLRPEIAKIVDGMEFTDIGLNETHRKFVVSATVPLLEYILVSALQTMIVDEKSLVLDIGEIRIKASRSYVKDIELHYVSETAKISIPSTVLSGRKDLQDEVFQVLISHERNPYTYGYRITAWAHVPVQTISFYDTDGSYIQVADLPDNATVGLCMFSSFVNTSTCMGKEMINENDVTAVNNLYYKNVTLAPLKSKVWQVPSSYSEVGSGVGVHIQLRFSFLSINSSDSTITAYLGINFVPKSDHYSHKLILNLDLMDKGVDHRKYTFFQKTVTNFAFSNLNPSDKLHIVVTNNNNQYDVELLVGIYFSSCEYFNTTSQVWADNGCQAQEESTAVITSCQCNHLTSFGGAGIVSITDIDFEDLDNLNILTNPVVFIAVAIIFVIYILVAILCHHLDRLDLRRISMIPLCGPVGSFLYEITVITGYHYNAGTSAHVGFKLYGTSGKGEARHLTKTGAFQRNCRDTFIIANSTDLGEITKILVWHDNTGLSPSWFVSNILVKDLQTDSVYTFLITSWLSLEMDDGIVQTTVQASGEKELKEFYSQFSNVFHSLMADLHTWISVSNKPDHSRFTRVQRSTCCLTCLYLFMTINAIWFGIFKDQTKIDLPLTWSFFGWEDVVIALVSTLMVVPFVFGLALIFKKSRCKASMFQEALRPQSALTLEIDAVCTISADGSSYRTATPLGDWIPALDRESTIDSFSQVPVGLKRTVPMHRDRRKGSSDSSASGKGKLPNTGSRKNFWNKESIMQNWPDAVPHLLNKTKVQTKYSGMAQNEGGSAVSQQIIQPVRKVHKNKTGENSDDDLQQKLDEAEAVIAKDEEKRKKRLALKVRQANGDGLFDSDDEWVNDKLENVVNEDKSTLFNLRKETELQMNGRRTSRTSFTLPNAMSHKSESMGGSKRESSSMQTGARPSIVSSSSKSKSTLSGRLRSLSVVSQMSLQKHSGCMLPSWCVYVAYALCVMLCVLSVILVLLYGYNFGRNVAIKWVLSLCLTFFISILVVEPLKVLVLAVYTKMHAGDIGKGDSDMIDIKPKVEFNEQIKDVKFRPLGGFALLQAKEEGKKKQRLHTMLREVLVFSFMFAMFLAIVYMNYSSDSMYLSTSNIHNKFYANLNDVAGNSRRLNITNLKSIPEFWQWTQTVLATSLHYRQLYQMENFGYLMGPAWLRQIRGELATCPAALKTNLLSVPELVTRKCLDSGTSDPDMASYATGWLTGSANWTYFSSSQLNSFAKFGQSLMYLGGGYIQRLGLTYQETLATLQQLEAEGWMDMQTRVVFVEVTLYNPSKDLTSCVTLVLELPITGGILASSYIWTEHLLRFIPGQVDPLMVCQIMFFPFVLYLTVTVSTTLKSQKLLFFTHFWNWLDLFTCIFVWANCVLYIMCVVMATSEITAFLKDLTVPAQLEKVALLHGILRDVHACLVFLFSLKIVRQVRFFQPLYKLYITMSTASTPLLGVFFLFAMLLLTYAQFGYLLYGSAVYGYHSFQHSLMSLFGLMGGYTNFWPMFECKRILTHLFFISFGIFVYGLVTALSVAVLTWSFKLSCAQMAYKTSLEARDYEMIEFMIKRFKLITGMQKQKPLFRRVKFEGLPSLPSRGTSSNISCRSRSSPALIASESRHTDTTEEYLHHCMASLKPAWDQVVKTVQKIEDLDKQVEEKLQNILRQIMKSSPTNSKIKLSNTQPIVGKPPMYLKSTFPGFKLWDVGKDITPHSYQLKMTQPSTSTSDIQLYTTDKSLPNIMKIRPDLMLVSNELQPKKRLFYSSHKVSPSEIINRNSATKGKVSLKFLSSNSRVAESKCKDGISASKHGVDDLEDKNHKQRQMKKNTSQDTEL